MNTKVLKDKSVVLIVMMLALVVFAAAIVLPANTISAGAPQHLPGWDGDRGQAVAKVVLPIDMRNGFGDLIPDATVPYQMTDNSAEPRLTDACGQGEWKPG